MAWCRQATSHYLSQCWPRSMSPYGVIRPKWVNIWYYTGSYDFTFSFISYKTWIRSPRWFTNKFTAIHATNYSHGTCFRFCYVKISTGFNHKFHWEISRLPWTISIYINHINHVVTHSQNKRTTMKPSAYSMGHIVPVHVSLGTWIFSIPYSPLVDWQGEFAKSLN